VEEFGLMYKRTTIIVALLMLSVPALCRTITVLLPTTYLDNTAIDNTDYIYVNYYYGPSVDGPWTYLATSGYADNTWEGNIPCSNCWLSAVAMDNICQFAPAWDNETAYTINRVVTYSDNCYMSAVDNNIDLAPASYPGQWYQTTDNNSSGYSPAYMWSIPVLLTPIDNAVAGWPVDFTWNIVTGAIKYHIQVDDSASFATPEIDDDTITDASCDETDCHYLVESTDGLTHGRHYYWRVRALR
jgi:hypothetical protein